MADRRLRTRSRVDQPVRAPLSAILFHVVYLRILDQIFYRWTVSLHVHDIHPSLEPEIEDVCERCRHIVNTLCPFAEVNWLLAQAEAVYSWPAVSGCWRSTSRHLIANRLRN